MPPPLDQSLEDANRFGMNRLRPLGYLPVCIVAIILTTRATIMLLFINCMANLDQFTPEGTTDRFTDAQIQSIVMPACIIVGLVWACLVIIVAIQALRPRSIRISRTNEHCVVLDIPGHYVRGFNVHATLALLRLRSIDLLRLRHMDEAGLLAAGFDRHNLQMLIRMNMILMREIETCTSIVFEQTQLTARRAASASANREATVTTANTIDNASDRSTPTASGSSQSSGSGSTGSGRSRSASTPGV